MSPIAPGGAAFLVELLRNRSSWWDRHSCLPAGTFEPVPQRAEYASRDRQECLSYRNSNGPTTSPLVFLTFPFPVSPLMAPRRRWGRRSNRFGQLPDDRDLSSVLDCSW